MVIISPYMGIRKGSPLSVYRNDPKFSEEQSDQGLHCLPFRLHCLDSLLYGRAT